ncbi:hypothetical protein [Mycoplasma sp. 5370]
MFKNKYIKISKDTEKSIERRAIKEAKQELKENQQELGMDFLLNDKQKKTFRKWSKKYHLTEEQQESVAFALYYKVAKFRTIKKLIKKAPNKDILDTYFIDYFKKMETN